MALHINEPFSEFADFHRETGHSAAVITLSSGIAMIQGSVGLLPSDFVPSGAGGSDQQIRTTTGKRVEHRIIGCADGATKIDLPRSAPVAASSASRQMPGDAKQFRRIHYRTLPVSRYFFTYIFSHSDLLMNDRLGR